MQKIKQMLYVLQLEGYDLERFNRWLKNNDINLLEEKKQKINLTFKARLIFYLTLVIDFITLKKISFPSLVLGCKIISLGEKLALLLITTFAKFKINKYKGLTTIGITGSYGKTSVKEILAHFVSNRFNVLKTPHSYNTIIGISKVIIQNLNSKHNLFIVEMGAYNRGDIKVLCDLVKPKIGIITAIGKQHLERFGSEEVILKTKFELLENLPKDGKAFLNIHDAKIRSKALSYPEGKIIFYGICLKCNLCHQQKNSNCNNLIKVSDISTNIKGTCFQIQAENGIKYKIFTKLLGKHNVLNILAAINVAYYLKIPLDEIVQKCTTLQPIPHRLEIIPSKDGEATIIDDSFNANPDSAISALEVLSEIKARKKIVLTPGLIELGEKQAEENSSLGELLVRSADIALIIGETNKNALIKGVKQELSINKKVFGYHYYSSLEEAVSSLKDFIVPDTLILFENDLPDQYK